jgi:hypothetical protein
MGQLDVTLETPLWDLDMMGLDLEEVFEEQFGIRLNEDQFTWEKDAIGDRTTYCSFKIGTKTLDVSRAATLGLLVENMVTAIAEEFSAIAVEEYYLCSINQGMSVIYDCVSLDLDSIGGLKGIFNYLSKSRYCDTEFEDLLTSLGYNIITADCSGYDDFKYIDISDSINGEKIWLDVIDKANTLYSTRIKRKRVEILYLLNAINYKEMIFGTEL